MTFRSLREIVDAELSGAFNYASFRKVASQNTSPGIAFDMSMSPGNPAPQYYASSPLVAVQMKRSVQGGLNHGQSVSPRQKVLRSTTFMANAVSPIPAYIHLLDYLLYYPFLEESTTDEQFLDNTASLPRYTNGLGVQIMAVSVASRAGGQTFRVKYTNSDGVSGRLTSIVTQNNLTANGNIVSAALNVNGSSGLFLPLQAGDKGVRSIESFQMISGTDVGLLTLVLVKPLAQTMIAQFTAPTEVDYYLNKGLALPVIEDDAYLNIVCVPSNTGNLAGVAIIGDIKTIWN